MLKKKLALLLVTAMVLTTSIPVAFAGDTIVDAPQAITSETLITSEGAIVNGGDESSNGGITTEEAITTDKSASSEGAITTEKPETQENSSVDQAIEKAEEENDLTKILKESASEPKFDNSKDSVMYHHLEKLSQEIGARVASTKEETEARDYIKAVFERLGYEITSQPFHWERKDKNGEVVKQGDSTNVIAIKPGKTNKQVIVGAHYDSVNASTGASDNASGVSVMLGAAEMLKNENTEYTIKFVAFGAEEVGLKGSSYYASQMSKDEISNTVAMVNLDTVLFGDKKYVYGNLGEKGWLCDQALKLSKSLDLDIITQQGLNPEYPKGTTGDWSDHEPFNKLGIPWVYFESTNWDLKDADGNWSTGENETEQFGEIMHTERDNLDFMNKNIPDRVGDRLYSYTTLLYHLLKEINPPAIEAESGITVSNNLLSMSEEREIEISIDLGYAPKLEDLTWSLGGKSFDQWKSFNLSDKDFTGEPFIKFTKEPMIEGNIVKAVIKCDLPFGTTNLEKRPYPRRAYPKLLGEYDLVVIDKTSNTQAKTIIKLNAYDSYHKQGEIKPAVEKIIADSQKAMKERYIEYAPLGKSAEGRDIPFVMFAKEKSDIDKYLNETLPMMLERPAELLSLIENHGVGQYKPAIWFNNIHSDEANGVDAQLDMLEKLATQDEITFKRATKNNSKDSLEEVTLNVQELLDNYIILFSLNNNPDGRFYNNREMVSGFDPNRDVTYQTQIETATVFQALAKWSPMIFNDYHGFVKEFLIEPCTPPHDPNFEYDLLMSGAINHAHALGKAGIANTKYNNYIIPMFDYGQGWDDGAPMYAAVLSQMHGAIGHTVEIPELNQESNNAFMYAGFGSMMYALENKEALFKNQVEIYKRGVEGIDSRGVDKWLVNAKGDSIGRPRGSNENFFPEYYVLPVSNQLQKNPLAAYEMVDFLIKNGVKVQRTNTNVQVGDVTYPSGSFIIPMHQAKRGFANCVLYDGSDFSDFAEMYAEVTMCFPALRGFDKYEIRQSGAFEGKASDVSKVSIPATEIPSGSEQIIIKNTNNDAIKAVNELLAMNKTVSLTYSSGESFAKGDFIVAKNDLEGIKTKYFLELEPFQGKATIKTIKQPKVAGVGDEVTYVLKELGFNVTDSYSNANVIADDSSEGMPQNIKNAIKDGTSYVAMGGYAMHSLQTSGLLSGFELGGFENYYEGVLKAILETDSVITGRYSKNDILYNNTDSWIEKVPSTAKVLATISDKDDFYVAGWWPNHGEVKGKPYIIQDQVGDSKITVFASHLTNKAHTSHQFRLLANSIYDSLSGTLTEISSDGPVTEKYTITVIAGEGGTVSPATVSVDKGTDQSFTIKANTGYVINDVEVDGKSAGAVESYKFTNVTSTHTIKATFKLNDGPVTEKYTITVTAGEGGTVSPATVSVDKGTDQSFTIKANTGYVINDVQVDGKSVGAVESYKFTNVTSTHTIKATFKLNDGPVTEKYTITVIAGEGGTVSPATVSVDKGTDQSFTIKANTGYVINDVEVDGKSAGAVESYKFTNVTSTHTIKATFKLNDGPVTEKYMITVTAGEGGTVSPATVSVDKGTDQSFTIKANTGYVINDVQVDGKSVGAVESYKFTNVTSTHTIKATFKLNDGPVTEKYTITVTAGEGGTVSPATVSVDKGTDQSFTIKANTGYVINDVQVDGKSVGAVESYKFTNVTSTHTIKAAFKLNGGSSGGSKHKSSKSAEKYTITVTAGKGGSISPSTASVEKGSNQNFTIKADKGYAIEDVKVDGKSIGAVESYKFINVTSTHTIKATFKISSGVESSNEGTVKYNFKDVPSGSWFSPAVNYVMQKGIMKGLDNNSFGPNVNTNRAMIVTMLYRLEGQPQVENSTFSDVNSNVWYSAPITWANSSQVVTGYEGNMFKPNDSITREQLAAILYRYAKYKKADLTVKGNLDKFSDNSQVAIYAKEAISWAVGTGLMTGKSGNKLDPKGPATRAEVAAMFQRIESLI